MKRLLVLIILILIFTSANATILFEDDFESYSLGTSWNTTPDPYSLWKANTPVSGCRDNEVVDSQANSGSKSIELWSNCDCVLSSRREEIIFEDGAVSPGTLDIDNLTEYWVRFYRYLPSDYPVNASNNQVNFQIKGVPDTSESTGLNPYFSFNIHYDKYEVHIRADDRLITPDDNSYDRNDTYTIDDWASDAGVWVEWIFHFKLDYNGGSNYMEIYKNGELLWEDLKAGLSGASNGMGFYDLNGGWISMGLYTNSYPTGNIFILYLDDAKVGDGGESLLSMTEYSEYNIIFAPTGFKIVGD